MKNNCICPECKNDINISKYPNISVGMIIECDICGITLLVKKTEGQNIETEIIDEGK